MLLIGVAFFGVFEVVRSVEATTLLADKSLFVRKLKIRDLVCASVVDGCFFGGLDENIYIVRLLFLGYESG